MANELAQNFDVQEKLRKEIDEVIEKHGPSASYDVVMNMKYLDMVVNGSFNPRSIHFHKIKTKLKNI